MNVALYPEKDLSLSVEVVVGRVAAHGLWRSGGRRVIRNETENGNTSSGWAWLITHGSS